MQVYKQTSKQGPGTYSANLRRQRRYVRSYTEAIRTWLFQAVLHKQSSGRVVKTLDSLFAWVRISTLSIVFLHWCFFIIIFFLNHRLLQGPQGPVGPPGPPGDQGLKVGNSPLRSMGVLWLLWPLLWLYSDCDRYDPKHGCTLSLTFNGHSNW